MGDPLKLIWYRVLSRILADIEELLSNPPAKLDCYESRSAWSKPELHTVEKPENWRGMDSYEQYIRGSYTYQYNDRVRARRKRATQIRSDLNYLDERLAN